MKTSKVIGLIVLFVGIGLIIYGVNHMNSTESEIKDFFGKEDTTGMFTALLGAALAIGGGVIAIRK
ncbi:DUF3185 family protein [Flavobacterium selenitireducens]|uniref:DUF3185 family protein n=1 Tax=Flavobacterium selenitireducens TaxID=2722704 RepID=UPI00168AC744|nr:DUF3185 family protein [Flavobacterium selenitireducens]MBD3583002.1 DUF3185 family protein [Flavobacterium selenitireducens]